MALDLRTRSDADPVAVDAAGFFATDLPAALASRWPQPDRPLPPLNPLLLEVDGDRWTLSFDGDRPTVAPGDPVTDRWTHLRLTAGQLQDLVVDLITPIGLMTAGALDLPKGSLGQVLDWWLVLRATLDTDPQGPPSAVDLPDDLSRSFTLDDDPAEIRRFLEQTGFAHIRGVFTADEMARISDDMDSAAGTYSPGDGRSWWAGTADGADRLVRMQYFEEHSPTARGPPRRRAVPGPGPAAGLRPPVRRLRGEPVRGAVQAHRRRQGISDVPWHKDCSLGRHSYECCALTVGVSVTGAGPTTGQLRVIAGLAPGADLAVAARRRHARPARRGPRHRDRRRHRAPQLHAPHGPAAHHGRAPGALHQLHAPPARRRGPRGRPPAPRGHRPRDRPADREPDLCHLT